MLLVLVALAVSANSTQFARRTASSLAVDSGNRFGQEQELVMSLCNSPGRMAANGLPLASVAVLRGTWSREMAWRPL